MKKKKLTIIALSIGVILVIAGISALVYSYIHNENQKQQKNEQSVIKYYEDFKSKVESFNKVKIKYSDDVESDLFIESVEADYKLWIETIDEYKIVVDIVETESEKLKNLCINQYYQNKDAQNKCEAFIIAYETVVNYYVKDIDVFNEFIKEYNKKEKKNLKQYQQNKYQYIDINDDGKFIGKD